jgi:hypothetical protein
MKNLFDQLQLRPHERRLVVIGAVVLFGVLNLWFVWPHYGDRARVIGRLQGSTDTLGKFESEMTLTNQHLALLQELEHDGAGVLDEDKDITLLATVQRLIRSCDVSHASITPAPRAALSGTNEFFEQRALSIVLNPNDPEPLIRFLISLATNDVVLRVKELDLKTDGTKTKLAGSLRVVASFQRKQLAPPSAPASTQPTPRS